jgi:hypothetical protein
MKIANVLNNVAEGLRAAGLYTVFDWELSRWRICPKIYYEQIV